MMRIGVLVSSRDGTPTALMERVRDLGFPTCEVVCWDADWLNDEVSDELKIACRASRVEITSIWTGLPGKSVWDIIDGPTTIGLVPPHTRELRMRVLKRSSDFARGLGVANISTHVGFIPESPSNPLYAGVIKALTDIAAHCETNGQGFLLETGQETPFTLLRTLEDVGADNLGVSFDGANLLAYGTGNPVDALDMIGAYVRVVHAKDAEYPTSGRSFGAEKPLGQGQVNYPALIAKLEALGYEGPLTIEREISGQQWVEDVKAGRIFLEGILASL